MGHRVRSQPFDRLRAGSQNPVGQASLPAKEWSPDKHPESKFRNPKSETTLTISVKMVIILQVWVEAHSTTVEYKHAIDVRPRRLTCTQESEQRISWVAFISWAKEIS